MSNNIDIRQFSHNDIAKYILGKSKAWQKKASRKKGTESYLNK
jgi:hypothetical protein